MRRVILSGAIAAGFFLAPAGTAYACSCKQLSPADYARWVSTLIEGEIVATKIAGDKQTTTLRILRVIKGAPSLRRAPAGLIRVVTIPHGAACGYRFPAKGRMMVALRSSAKGHWTGLCTMMPLKGPNAPAYIEAVRASAKK